MNEEITNPETIRPLTEEETIIKNAAIKKAKTIVRRLAVLKLMQKNSLYPPPDHQK